MIPTPRPAAIRERRPRRSGRGTTGRSHGVSAIGSAADEGSHSVDSHRVDSHWVTARSLLVLVGPVRVRHASPGRSRGDAIWSNATQV
jgi:hypothetical protein